MAPADRAESYTVSREFRPRSGACLPPPSPGSGCRAPFGCGGGRVSPGREGSAGGGRRGGAAPDGGAGPARVPRHAPGTPEAVEGFEEFKGFKEFELLGHRDEHILHPPRQRGPAPCTAVDTRLRRGETATRLG